MVRGACLIVAALALCVAAQYQLDPDLIVPTTAGKVYGEKYDAGRAFRGIPYAAPPVGRKGRWQLPQPVTPWGTDALPTRDYRPGCAQRCVDGKNLPPHTCPQLISEDCLYLNVYTPPVDRNVTNLPVLFFIHGGNFVAGAGNLLYEGLSLANLKDVVVVTINYRLGAFGFLVMPGLSDGAVLNLGIEDQRMALRWVQDNIANFGGDPSRVTIFGQSAGARSVITHLVSPSSHGLFAQAAYFSDPNSIVLSDIDDALALGERFATAIGCASDDTDCLYSKDMDEVIEAAEEAVAYLVPDSPISSFMQLLPTVDGVEITGQPFRLLIEGQFKQVPLLMGTVSEETVLYIYSAWPQPVSSAYYRTLMNIIMKENATEVLDMYPPVDGDDQREVMATVGTYFTFTCPNRYAMRYVSERVPTYIYLYDHAWSFDGWGDHFDFCRGRVCHGGDLPIEFDTGRLLFELTSDELALSQTVMHYLGNFAWSSDPNTNGRGHVAPVKWSRYTAADDAIMHWTVPEVKMISGWAKEDCDFWDTISYDPLRKDPGAYSRNFAALYNIGAPKQDH